MVCEYATSKASTVAYDQRSSDRLANSTSNLLPNLSLPGKLRANSESPHLYLRTFTRMRITVPGALWSRKTFKALSAAAPLQDALRPPHLTQTSQTPRPSMLYTPRNNNLQLQLGRTPETPPSVPYCVHGGSTECTRRPTLSRAGSPSEGPAGRKKSVTSRENVFPFPHGIRFHREDAKVLSPLRVNTGFSPQTVN